MTISASTTTPDCEVTCTGPTLVVRRELDPSTRDVFARAGDHFVAHCPEELDQAAASGIQMRLFHPAARRRRLSAICRLDDILGMYPGDRPPAVAGGKV